MILEVVLDTSCLGRPSEDQVSQIRSHSLSRLVDSSLAERLVLRVSPIAPSDVGQVDSEPQDSMHQTSGIWIPWDRDLRSARIRSLFSLVGIARSHSGAL